MDREDYELFPSTGNLDRREYVTLLAALGTPAIAGCSADEDPDDVGDDTADDDTTPDEDEDVHGGILRASLESPIDNLDPGYASTAVSFVAINQVIDSLFIYDGEMNVVPELATDVEPSNDGESWIVSLREGVMFQPPHERELVAEDVVYNFERRMDPDAGTIWESEIAAIDEVTAIDDYTVEFDLGEISATQPGLFAKMQGSFIVSPDALEEGDGDVRSNPVGTGPFKFESWDPGDRLELSRFDNYWQEDKPYLDGVEMRIIDEPTVRLTELQQGNLNIIRGVEGDFAPELEEDPNITLKEEVSQSVRMVMLNTTEEQTEGRAEQLPTTHLEIRHAISEAIDREAMVEIITNGYGTTSQQAYTEGMPWYVDYEPYSNDANPDRALELIDEAGFDTPVDINIMSASDEPSLREIGRVTQDMLNNAGFDAELDEFELGTWAENMFDLKYDITPNFMGSLTVYDGHRIWFHSEDSVTQHYGNPEIDELFDEARRTVDEDARLQMYEDATRILIDDLPNCYLYHPMWLHAHTEDVMNYEPHVDMSVFALQDVQLSE